MPPYYKQENEKTCSLAVLRMALAFFEIKVSEEELLSKITPEYGTKFSNIWNSTIAKLASEYGVETSMYALWPLLKSGIFPEALKEFKADPENFNAMKYENPGDRDKISEPLILAYKEMFAAVDHGCKVEYEGLTKGLLIKLINDNQLIQTSVKVHKLYSGAPRWFHSILIYGVDDNEVMYHDPFVGPSLSVDIDRLVSSAQDIGAFMSYKSV